MIKKIFTLLFLSQTCFAQDIQNISFANPLNISINASGNFGELRGSHFHTGIDIKTQQRIGLPIYAPADGYVSRIKVSTWGYGKALYINHPNGITTVYGHLNGYEGAIAKKVFDTHYKEKKFEIEMFLRKDEIPVKKGDIIAYSGNSGGSGGPHLHYEFRDTKTENIINPLKMGMDKMLVDTEAPSVNKIYVYPIGNTAVANKSQVPIALKTSTNNEGNIITETVYAKGQIGFGIEIYDTANFNANKNGVYTLQTSANGTNLFSYTFNEFSFAETNFVNALIDYGIAQKTKQKIQKLFYTKEYPLTVLNVNKPTNGTIQVNTGESYNYLIVLKDYHGNTKQVTIPVSYSDNDTTILKKESTTGYKIDSDREFVFEKNNISVSIPKLAFYNNFIMDIEVKDNVLTLHKNTEPVAKSIAVSFDTKDLALSNPDKSFIARIENNKKEYFKTHKKGTIYTAYVKKLGDYTILADEIAPEIYAPSFTEGQWLSNASSISLKVKDNLSGIQSIEGFINGKWILLDYDYKTNTIKHLFEDGIVTSGRNEVLINVLDNVGNKTSFESHFMRK